MVPCQVWSKGFRDDLSAHGITAAGHMFRVRVCVARLVERPGFERHRAYPGQSVLAGPSVNWAHLARPLGRSAVSRFTPWKNRIKSVLEEPNDKLIEERDLGPVVLPGQRFILGTYDLDICTLPTFPHLRC